MGAHPIWCWDAGTQRGGNSTQHFACAHQVDCGLVRQHVILPGSHYQSLPAARASCREGPIGRAGEGPAVSFSCSSCSLPITHLFCCWSAAGRKVARSQLKSWSVSSGCACRDPQEAGETINSDCSDARHRCVFKCLAGRPPPHNLMSSAAASGWRVLYLQMGKHAQVLKLNTVKHQAADNGRGGPCLVAFTITLSPTLSTPRCLAMRLQAKNTAPLNLGTT